MTGTTERRSPGGSSAVHPCLWMSAGLVSYKLCDRDFDCERCPLDAALRGEPRGALAPVEAGDGDAAAAPAFTFPADRRYGDGHTWVAPPEGPAGPARVGIDAFAAALAAPVRRRLPRAVPGERTSAGSVLVDLELEAGTLPVASPVAGRLGRHNPRWDAGTAALTAAPYEGWLAEIELADPAALDALVDAGAARDRALLDLRRFRRRAALQLLAADAATVGPTLPDGGRIVTDLRAILGPRRYLELLRELLG